MNNENMSNRLYNGESLDDLMSRVANIVYKIDTESILRNDHPLHGLRKRCKEENRPMSDLAWRLLVLETCGQIGYDQLDYFFEPGDALTWKVKDQFRDHILEK